MARQSINVNPGFKEFEAYMDFSGGLNTETSNERLNDNEFTQLQNVELNSRGSIKKRTGRSTVFITGLPTQNPQGVFFFYRKDRDNPDTIFAVDGRLFIKKDGSANADEIFIQGMLDGFDKDVIVEAVQYYTKLYVATGKNLVVISSDEFGFYTAEVVKPYEPNTNELKYIGTNALLGFKMNDTINPTLTNVNQFQVKGITFSEESTGNTLINAQTKERFIIRAYVIENPSGLTIPTSEYYFKTFSFYYRKSGFQQKETLSFSPAVGTTVFEITNGSSYDINTNSIEVYINENPQVTGVGFTETSSTKITLEKPTEANDKVTIKWIPSWYSENSKYGSFSQIGAISSNQFVFRPLEIGDYDFKIVVKFAISNTVSHTDEYIFQGVQSKPFKEDGDVVDEQTSGVKKCNRIRLHKDRLVLFGDPDEPTQMYFSDLDNPAYFPQVNTLRFDTGKQEPITTVVRLHDYLVVFSKTMIHVLTGRTTEDFSISLINDSIGCVAPRSAVLTGNVITFLSEEGVFSLRPSTFKLDQLNVQRVDVKIKNQIKKSSNACALNYDSQYWLCYPDDNVIYRYYYERGVWVKDYSQKLNFVQFLQEGQDVYSLSKDVKFYKNNPSIYTDGGLVYDMIVESKYFDLSKAFNFKKLRRLYVLGRCYNEHDAEFYTTVYSDNVIVLDPEFGEAKIIDNTSTWVVTMNPNFVFEHGSTFGVWELGEDEFGEKTLSVQKARIRGKCRRAKLKFVNSQPNQVELFGFGLEFKLKKP
jgi:hypothetical protein